MRAILIGAVESTRIALEELAARDHAPVAVFTLPPEKAARHSDFVDLGPLTRDLGVALETTADVNDTPTLERIRALRPELVFVIGWSQICRAELLAIPSAGCIGYHPALLPENRGRGVIPWTILQRRAETGASLFWLDEGVDSGPILAQVRFDLGPDESATSLYDRHSTVLRELMGRAVEELEGPSPTRLVQDHSRASWCARRRPSDGLIDWSRPADEVWTLIRAVTDPYPGAFSFLDSRKLVVWDATFVGPAPYWGLPGQVQQLRPDGALVQCGDRGHVCLRTVQLDGDERRGAAEVLKMHVKLGLDPQGARP